MEGPSVGLSVAAGETHPDEARIVTTSRESALATPATGGRANSKSSKVQVTARTHSASRPMTLAACPVLPAAQAAKIVRQWHAGPAKCLRWPGAGACYG